MNNQIHHFLNKVINFGAAMLVIVFAFTFGPWIEGKFFPVITNIEAQFLQIDGDKMIYQIYGNKSRNCSLLDIRVLVENGNIVPAKGAIWVANDGIGSATRPLGLQDLGKWAVTPVGHRATIHAAYRCHAMWNTEVQLGVWER